MENLEQSSCSDYDGQGEIGGKFPKVTTTSINFRKEDDQIDGNQASLPTRNAAVDGEASDCSTVAVPVRRIWPKRHRNYIPRVVKRDIRRYYATMIANIFNSGSLQLLMSFFQCYAVPAFRMNMRQIDPVCYAHLPLPLQSYVSKFANGMSFDGQEWLTFHSMFSQMLSPSQAFRVEEARLITRARTKRSIIIMSTEIEMSRSFDVNTLEVLNSAFSFEQEQHGIISHVSSQPAVESKRDDNIFPSVDKVMVAQPNIRGKLRASSFNTGLHVVSSSPSSSDSVTMQDIHGNAFGPLMTPLLKPRQFTMKSQLVLVINEQKRIEYLTMGDGRLPPDLLEYLETVASLVSQSPAAESI